MRSSSSRMESLLLRRSAAKALRSLRPGPSAVWRASVPALSIGGDAAAVRSIGTFTRVLLQATQKTSDLNEAALEQQIVDFMRFADDDNADSSKTDQVNVDIDAALDLPLSGVVVNVKNHIASISGLRKATIGSVVAVRGPDDALLCRGVVLFLQKKVSHVALLESQSDQHAARSVQIGMNVTLESESLEIHASAARFAGKVITPLGELAPFAYAENEAVAGQELDEEEDQSPVGERISLAWGAKSVPGIMTRGPFRGSFPTGIMAIDCFKPLAYGHRFGILGPRNSGKTRLMLDMMAHHIQLSRDAGTEPPHFVYVCAGKSQARVQQIVQFLEQADAMKYTTIVFADERESLILQYLAPFSGCAIAEYFMNKGTSNNKSVVIYDDLATHTMVVENLVQTMKLPKISQLNLNAHTILMERSAQFLDPRDHSKVKSLTTFVLADAPDSTGIPTEFQERVTSMVDDSIGLEGSLALQRVYPPVDVLTPGTSVRGYPFQSALMWTCMTKLRSRVNASSQAKEAIEVSKKLGFEVEPEDAEVLEFQDLVTQFFTQKPLVKISQCEKEIGVFFLTIAEVSKLPAKLSIWEFVRDAMRMLEDEHIDLLHLIQRHPVDRAWSPEIQMRLTTALLTLAATQRKEQLKQRQSRRRLKF